MNTGLIEKGVALILEGLDVDPYDHNFNDTLARVARVYQELFEPPNTNWPVFEENYTDIVVLRGYQFHTLCPHHLLPVRLHADLAYVPRGKVIGASKLMRLIHDVNNRPRTQEALTNAILVGMETILQDYVGAAVLLRGSHGCFSMRGVKSCSAELLTCKFSGCFFEDAWQEKFYQLVSR